MPITDGFWYPYEDPAVYNTMLLPPICHDRDMKTMGDPEWLEVIGHPSIPHVQSLRAPPAQMAMHSNKENLIGLANRNASKRYLEKLQKDRERNQEVLHECVDNLPIVIRQMVYPDKPSPAQSLRLGGGGGGSSNMASREKRFRVGKPQDDGFWQENIEQWMKPDTNNNQHQLQSEHSNQTSLRRAGSNGIVNAQERKHTLSNHSESASENVDKTSNEYVHHPGFYGSTESVSSKLKQKFGKKKSAVAKEHSTQPVTFKPKGFGSLYDELEFERRYKKVFDLNKHIHFVHSNFVTGQRIYKRNKLPPIGHIPSVHSDPTDGQDIFAIMSVQKFNHPDGVTESRVPDTSPRQGGTSIKRQQLYRSADGLTSKQRHKRHAHAENAQELDVPVGFVPNPLETVGNSAFGDIKGHLMNKEAHSRLSAASREDDSALGTLTEETCQQNGVDDVTCTQSEASAKTLTSKKSKISEDVKAFKPKLKKKHLSPLDQRHTPDYKTETTFEEPEPFNISVHVEIKPKDPNINGGDDIENERARESRRPIEELPETPSSDSGRGDNAESEEEHTTEQNTVYTGTKTGQFGLITQKVHYPDSVSESRSAKLFADKHNPDGKRSN